MPATTFMKSVCSLIFLCCVLSDVQSQHSLIVSVVETGSKNALPSSTVKWNEGNRTVIADSLGIAIFPNIFPGEQTLTISFTGFETQTKNVLIPFTGDTLYVELVQSEEEEEEEVVITATRISRTIANTPTRVEVISGEELQEKSNMRPGEIRMLLSESTGIQVQQTSATSFNAGIRIQGLEGRYTQLLRDGYPLYAGFSGGLSIMQITPLDLQQVEIIKGSASTLYGGGAIAGLVNLVSKTPKAERELSFMANGTSAGGLDLTGFFSKRFEKTGITVFAARNSNKAFDPASTGFTAIPKFERYTLNPRLFVYAGKLTLDAGITYVTEDRIGGSIQYIKEGGSGFFERNKTNRLTSQLGLRQRLSDNSAIQFKNSYSRFDRTINIPGHVFEAVQQSSFSELTFTTNTTRSSWVLGLNFLTDDLADESNGPEQRRDYHFNTFGAFVQNSFSISRLTVETGLRADYVNDYGFELLPRVSALLQLTDKLTTRIGGGLGYKTPTIFTEETERIHFRNVLPINTSSTSNERSVGGNWDINYRTTIGKVGVNINQMFFYTRLNNPLLLGTAPNGKLEFVNGTGHLDTRGIETNLRFLWEPFKLFIGYTYTDAYTHSENIREWLPLTARHRLNNVLMFEVEEKWKVGLEAYYFSRQKLNDGTIGRSYWIAGLMAEKIWKHLSVFINFENFTDTRQSKFGSIYTGSPDNPVFEDIYAPVEGFIVNGGFKLRF
jgi:outer membrane receptor for ferrienterochelin and colicins